VAPTKHQAFGLASRLAMTSRSSSSVATTLFGTAAFVLVGVAASTWFESQKKKNNQQPLEQHQLQQQRLEQQRRQQRSSSQTRSRFRSSDSPIQIICAPSTKEFNSCIDNLVSIEDEVLIIRGTTADASSNSGKTSVSSSAFDGGEHHVARVCGGRSPKVYQGSMWDIAALRDMYDGRGSNHEPSIVCIDFTNIHGNDIFIDSVVLIRLLRSVFGSTLSKIIIKSRILSNHSRSYQSCESFVPKAKQQLEEEQGSSSVAITRVKNTEEVQVICAVGVSDYRSTIPYVVQKGDRVLEIGCHFGKTTDLLAKAAFGGGNGDGNDDSSSVLGIDIGKKCIDRARKLYSSKNTNLRFDVMDAWDTGSILRECGELNVIFVDVGGISGYDGEFEALTLVKQLVCACGKSLGHVVIKSRCLRDHSSLFTHSDDVLRPATSPRKTASN